MRSPSGASKVALGLLCRVSGLAWRAAAIKRGMSMRAPFASPVRSPLEMVTAGRVRDVPMDSGMLQMLIPIVAIVTTFAFPVALVATFKWFKLKERELQIDAELRKTAGQALESRGQRLGSVILALHSAPRAKLSASPTPAQLMEPPAAQ